MTHPKEPAVGSETRGGMMDRERILEIKEQVSQGAAAFNGTEFTELCDLALLALTHADARQEGYREGVGPTYADIHKALSDLYALAAKLAAVVSATPSSAFKGWGRDPYELTRDFEAFKLPALTQARGERELDCKIPGTPAELKGEGHE